MLRKPAAAEDSEVTPVTLAETPKQRQSPFVLSIPAILRLTVSWFSGTIVGMIYTPDGWPTGTYGSILADPAWPFDTYSAKGKDRSPEKHYDCMTIGDIAGLPVGNLADKDCVLYMWAPGTWIANGVAQWIMEWGWGFKPKTFGFVWTKEKPSGAEHVGLGYWSRDNPEFCLLGTRGRPKRLSASVRKWIHAAVREHSRKPDEIYKLVEELSEGPYCELFSRTIWNENWTVWGDQQGMFTPEQHIQAALL